MLWPEPESKSKKISCPKKKKKKIPQIHLEKLQSGGFSAISTGAKPPAASVLSHSSAIVRDSSNVAPTPPLLFQNAEHGHHIILISLLSETCQRPSLCHEEAPVPKGLGQSRVFPTRSVHQSVWGWVRRNTHQPLPPYGTLAARRRPLTCLHWEGSVQEAGAFSQPSAPIWCSHAETPLVTFTRIRCQCLPRVFLLAEQLSVKCCLRKRVSAAVPSKDWR